MKKQWLLITMAAFSMALATSAIACGGNSNASDAGTSVESTPADPGQGASGEPVNVTFQELNDSGVSGTATLVETGQGLEVKISLSGLKPGTYQAHIHPHAVGAMCPVPYPTALPGGTQPTPTRRDVRAVALPDLVANDSGSAEETVIIARTGVVGIAGAPVDSTLADFQDSNSKIEVYDLSLGVDRNFLAACGDLPAS